MDIQTLQARHLITLNSKYQSSKTITPPTISIDKRSGSA
jgi:hypothetical protein